MNNINVYLNYLIPKKCALNTKNGEILKSSFIKNGVKYWTDKNGIVISEYVEAETCELYASAGSLIDFDTDQLNFDINHPVSIEVQPSYDGSVNLIINDDKNIPRLINSRFSAREKNTYEIVDRIGENDTNIYNSKTFDKDTSLYFQYETNPVIDYKGYVSGILPVGQYCFYFTYCDADDNESDFIAESGLIPVFIGGDGEPYSMNGGIKNENSNKGIKFKLTNIDKSYNYFKVYYVRYFADYQQNRVFEGKKIYKKYPINSGTVYLQITGNESAEDIDPNILNFTRFNPKNVLAQAQCKNILFFGNIVKNTDNYKELQDCALRIIPQLELRRNFKSPTSSYDVAGNTGYYDSVNAYNNVGYFNQEYYRFGVVFIYQNGTLSNVYNTLGIELVDSTSSPITYNKDTLFSVEQDVFKRRNYIEIDDDGWLKNYNKYYSVTNSKVINTINSKGVCRFNYSGSYDDKTIFGVKFKIDEEVQNYLREELGIRGLFFVRQKCTPTILAQCYLLPMDEQLDAPVIKYREGGKDVYNTECFVTQGTEKEKVYRFLTQEIKEKYIDGDRLVVNTYDSRLYKYKHKEGDPESSLSTNAYAAICPDFLLNQPYYNQIFNGNKFTLKQITSKDYLEKDGRFYKEIESSKTYSNDSNFVGNVTISSVTEDVPTVALRNKTYKLNIGEAEEVYRFEYAEVDNSTYDAGDEDFDAVNKASNIVRGIYSPYLAIYSSTKLETGQLYNIYQNNPELNTKQNYLDRMNSSEPFYAISNRYNFDGFNDELTCWRGDCYINLFTYRLNRNFNDPSLPNNDKIIDQNTWKDNYDITNQEKWADISRSDVNAVQMGSWITLKLRSGVNYALRSVDHSYVSEEALMGRPRSFYPLSELAWRGDNKIPDSYLYNDAFRASLGYKCYFTLSDVNYIKNTFSNRIQYSAISIQDSFKNNYRDSLSTYFRDYSQEYGSIQKLVGFEGHLLVVFEHAIGLAVINERVLAGEGEGEPVFINTRNVLPEELTIITDTYGTQWPESVIKSESGNVYGVDTISKKIWRVKGQQLELLSDFKVNKFLIENISLEERELYPIIGLRNVKTHYNNNKKDIMFTFYDDVYKGEEKVWNLCYNELLDQFVTFYSWVPSYSENIDTKFFTFNRNTSKALSLLYNSNYAIPNSYGVLLDTPVLDISDGKIQSIGKTSQYYDVSDIEWGGNDLDWEGNDADWLRVVKIETDGNNSLSYGGVEILYRHPGISTSTIINADGTILKPKYNPQFIPSVSFELEKDNWGNYKFFNIQKVKNKHSIYCSTITKDKDNDKVTNVINNVYFFDAYYLVPKDNESLQSIINYFENHTIMYLYITPKIEEDLDVYGLRTQYEFRSETVAITLKSILENPGLLHEDYYKKENGKDVLDDNGNKVYKNLLTTDFYLHGQAGIFNVRENLYPTHWYGKTHPFEFEFVVNDNVGYQKIFTDLMIISNKAEPESFHFEIEGDNYEFSNDKRAMYFRQEATKNLYQNLGSDMLYDRKFTDVTAKEYTQEQYYRKGDFDTLNGVNNSEYTGNYNKSDKVYPIKNEGLIQQVKSTIFPLYYEKVDTFDEIYHDYRLMNSPTGYDFKNLSGSEIEWNRDLNQFNIVTHIKNSPIDLVGRLRGNSRYKEGKWNIQIPSITFMQKNEPEWPLVENINSELKEDGPVKDWAGSNARIPYIVVNSSNIPSDLQDDVISQDKLPNIYNNSNYTDINDIVDTSGWTYRKETKIRDKWMKIRVRYSGYNLAIIHSVVTLYNRSYS